MPLIQLIIILVLIGVGLYLIETVVPMDPAIKTIIRVLVVLVVLLWILSATGLMGSGPVIRFR